MTITCDSATTDTAVHDDQGNGFRLSAIHCPTCGPGSDEAEIGVRGGAGHRFGRGVATRIVRCRGCGLYYANPFPFPLDAQRLYGDPAKYFVGHDMSAKVAMNRKLVASFLSSLGRREASLLDVGSGRGEMLAAARAEGLARVVGLELSSSMVEAAREGLGVEVLPMLVEDFAAQTDERFDIIVLNAVLEHVYDPDAMVGACARLLAPDGVLYLDIPNEDHLLAQVGAWVSRLRGRRDVYVLSPTFPPYHVFGFTPRALRKLLAKHGLAVERLRLHGSVRVRPAPGWRGRLAAWGGTMLNAASNVIGRGHNMFVWARPHR